MSVPSATDDTWEQIRAILRKTVPPAAYDNWLSRLEPRELSRRRVLLAAPDPAARWIADRFGRVLQASTAAVLGAQVEVDVVARSHTAHRPEPGGEGPAAFEEPELNPSYTFDRFVIGEGNRLAHAASLAVAEVPASAYNPLFICGPPGVGKTHLLHSIAAYARGFSDARVRCVTADWFTASFVGAIRSGAVDRFKASCRGADLLLVDDVQFLQDKTRTEEEFFHTFNALYETGSQLVFTSDRAPRDIAALEERLRERFASGLVAEIAAPDFSTRLTILRRWAAEESASEIRQSVLELLANRVAGNMRTLRGALTRLIAVSSLSRADACESLAEQVLADHDDARVARAPTVREIQDVICRVFGITREELVSAGRSARVAWPRQLAMHLAREHAGATLPAIGREFGGRDHTTVLYACRRASRRIEREPAVRKLAAHVEADIRNVTLDRPA